MINLWPWFAIAGLGALHGLSPANGWMFAAAWAVRARDAAQVRHALLPIAIGHVLSIAVVAAAVAEGLAMDRGLARTLAGAWLVAAASLRWRRGTGPCTPIGARAGRAGIALWSFLMATAHGAGLMLVPALVPLCLADNPARVIAASGSPPQVLLAVAVHAVAMLLTTGLIATGVCRGLALQPRLLSGPASRRAWTAALAVTGVLLMALH